MNQLSEGDKNGGLTDAASERGGMSVTGAMGKVLPRVSGPSPNATLT
jgi:hypothetical protein